MAPSDTNQESDPPHPAVREGFNGTGNVSPPPSNRFNHVSVEEEEALHDFFQMLSVVEKQDLEILESLGLEVGRNSRNRNRKDSVPHKCENLNNEFPESFSFAGCGFLGAYHLGVASALKTHVPHLLEKAKFAGASAGGFIAVSLLLDLPIGKIFFLIVVLN